MGYKLNQRITSCSSSSTHVQRSGPFDEFYTTRSENSKPVGIFIKGRTTYATPGYSLTPSTTPSGASQIVYYVFDGKRYQRRVKNLPKIRSRKAGLRSLPFSTHGGEVSGDFSWKEVNYAPMPGESPGQFLQSVTDWEGDLAYITGGPRYISGPEVVSYNELALRMAGQIKQGEFDAPLFLLEGRETVNMLLSISERLRRGAKSLLSGRFFEAVGHMFPDLYDWRDKSLPATRNGKRARYYDRRIKTVHRRWEEGRVNPLVGPARAASSAWLELQFGVLQILEDAKASAEYVAHRHLNSGNDGSQVLTCRASQRYVIGPDTPWSGHNFTVSDPTIPCFRRRRYAESGRMVLKYRVKSQAMRNLVELGLTNPVKLAVNMTRLSWVADWFVPLTKYFNQYDAYLGLEFLDGSWGYSADEVVEFKPVGDKGPHGSVFSFRVERMPLDGFPQADASVLLPRMPQVSAWRLTTSLALLGGALTRVQG